MIRKSCLFLCALALCFSLNAQNKMSAYTQLMLNSYRNVETADLSSSVKAQMLGGVDAKTRSAKAIIALHENEEAPLTELAELGVNVDCVLNGYITANIPVDAFEMVANLTAVKEVTMARPVTLASDAARRLSKVDGVHRGEFMSKAFNGEGVLLGIVDSGVDFNHINFKKEDGSTRIKIAGVYDRAYEAYNIYYNPEQILTLGTDNADASHGTHVAGIAGGGYKANGYYGMAPAADLGIFGLENNLYDADIINGIFWIFNQADSENKPSVVNVSIGSTLGPHDGTSYFNQVVDGMCGEGRIVVAASGNSGDEKIYLNKKFTSSSTELATIVEYSGNSYTSMADAWSNDDTQFGIQFFIYNRMDGTEIYKSSTFMPDSASYSEYMWSNVDKDLKNYFSGTIGAGGELSAYNNRYNMVALISGTTKNSNYRVGIRYIGKAGSEIHSWAYPSPNQFVSSGGGDYQEGSTNSSFNDMACGKNVISVGAYNSKLSFVGIGADGVAGAETYPFTYRNQTVGDISYFTGYGVDYTGRVHPDIVAPGFSLVSSVNSYDSNTVNANYSTLIDEVTIEGEFRRYHWGDMMGTSMASPVVTGVVALMLQANPNLTPTQVRDILQSTAAKDLYVNNSLSEQWGAGKVDAKAAVNKALKTTSIKDITMPDEEVMIYPNPSNGRFIVYVGESIEPVNVNIYNLNGALVYKNNSMPIDGEIDVNVTGQVAKGIYVVKVENSNINYSSRLIIK